MNTVDVELKNHSYPIYIGTNIIDTQVPFAKHVSGKSAFIVTNEVVAPYYLDRVLRQLHNIRHNYLLLPDGEHTKNLNTVNKILDQLIQNRCHRQTTLIALGGGVIGDITGFTAAVYLRGVPYIQVPTTLLAQVDSSVGGKTGVNHPLGKNLIGAFYQPQCVIVDLQTLSTLAPRELVAGIAEVIKYGVIRDYKFFTWLEQNSDRLLQKEGSALLYAVQRSCENKAAVVTADEKETSGYRAILNFGHTFGHAIETAMGYRDWLHGEAVGCGMVIAAKLSRNLGWLSDKDCQRIIDLVSKVGLTIAPPKGMSVTEFLERMEVDKKVADGQLRLVLLKTIGNAILTASYAPEILRSTLEEVVC